MAMSLNSTPFLLDPFDMTVLDKDVFISSVRTYAGVQAINWAATIVGKEVVLRWNAVPWAQYTAHQALYEAAASIVFDPTADFSVSYTYNVLIKLFTPTYLIGAVGEHAGETSMTLLVMSSNSR
jgi:hypothetical protein